jgi:DNA replication licensing factor MCM5
MMADDCEYIDQQTLKLQECPEAVPTGEMPRNIMLSGMIIIIVVVIIIS